MTDDQTSQADELTEMWDADSLREVLDAAPEPVTKPASPKGESSVKVDLASASSSPRRTTTKKKKKQELSPPVLILLATIVMVGSFLLVRLLR